MPLYDFQCTACKLTEEIMCSSDVLEQPCPDCKVVVMTRLVPVHGARVRPLKETGHRDLPSGTKPRYHRYNIE